jgi:HlyD family secretion protein
MKKWILWGVPALALIALVAWRFNNRAPAAGAGSPGGGAAATGGPRGGAGGAGGPGGPGGARTPSVEVAAASRRSIVNSIEAVGNIESPYRVSISPKSSGRIEFLEAREGDLVTPGQVLVRIDPSEVAAQVAQQQANVAEARSRLAQAKLTQGSTEVGVTSQIKQQRAGLGSAQAELNQVQRSYDSQVAQAKAQVSDMESRIESALAQARNAQAEVTRQEANLRNAQTRLDRVLSLYRQGFIAAQDVDDANTTVEVQRGAVEVAKGQLSAAQSAVSSARALKASAQNNVNIVTRKGQADIAAAKARVTQASAGVDVAQANRSQSPAYRENIAALRASVTAAEAQLRQAQARMRDTILRSTIKGTVTKRSTDPGTLASPGQAILEVQFLDWVYATTSLPIEQSSYVREGQTVSVHTDALPGQTFAGTITNINAAADPETRQFSIRVKLNNAGHKLRPGMYARVAIETGRIPDAIVVPREAVKTTDDGSTVTVVDAENKAHVVPVKTGATDAAGIQILDGVKPGDKVVTLSFTPVRDGQEVNVGGGGRPGGGGRGAQGSGPSGGRRRGGAGQ